MWSMSNLTHLQLQGFQPYARITASIVETIPTDLSEPEAFVPSMANIFRQANILDIILYLSI